MQAKCLKCKKLFNLDEMSLNEIEKLGKKGCLDCKSKNIEWKMEVEGINLHHITDECSTCKLPKIIDILNWEEIKGICIKNDFAKSKSELIKKMNDEDKNTCYCGKLEDSNREREREQKWV